MRARDQRRALNLPDLVSGRIASVSASSVTIATPRGALTIATPDAANYRPGDRVRIQSGVLLGAVRASPQVFLV